MRAIVLVLLIAACNPTVDAPTLPACAELGCKGLAASCKPGHCSCALSRDEEPMACVAYPACAELACDALACDGALCTCGMGESTATCED